MASEDKNIVAYVRKERYDPGRKEYVEDSIPTTTVSKFKRLITGIDGATGGILTSYTPGAGSGALRVCQMRLYAGSATTRFWMRDSQRGTIDYVMLYGAQDTIVERGNADKPLYVSKGTFTVGLYGTVATGGEYVVSWWGVQE
jgi:hypothetical protein